jgi:hypothetical protein
MAKKNTTPPREPIPTAREMANSPPALAHIELDDESKTAWLVYDHEPGWPQPGEPLSGEWGATVAAKALRCGKAKIVADYFRTNATQPLNVRCILADMLDPPPDCTEPRRLEFKYYKRTALKGHGLRRLELMGELANKLVRDGWARGKVNAAVKNIADNSGVSESDVYEGRRLIEDRGRGEFGDDVSDKVWSKRFDKKYGLSPRKKANANERARRKRVAGKKGAKLSQPLGHR